MYVGAVSSFKTNTMNDKLKEAFCEIMEVRFGKLIEGINEKVIRHCLIGRPEVGLHCNENIAKDLKLYFEYKYNKKFKLKFNENLLMYYIECTT